jgi:hypothetical protein
MTLRAPSAHSHKVPSTAEGISAGSTIVAPAFAILDTADSKAAEISGERTGLLARFQGSTSCQF